MHSTWFSSTFVSFLKFSQIKEGDLVFWGNHFCRPAELLGPPFCISIWEIWGTQILGHSVDFNAFYLIQQYFGSVFLNFLKLKRGDLISWGNQFCRTAESFGPPFCILIWEIWGTQILRHSVDFNAFYMIQQYFCQFFKIFSNERGGT